MEFAQLKTECSECWITAYLRILVKKVGSDYEDLGWQEVQGPARDFDKIHDEKIAIAADFGDVNQLPAGEVNRPLPLDWLTRFRIGRKLVLSRTVPGLLMGYQGNAASVVVTRKFYLMEDITCISLYFDMHAIDTNNASVPFSSCRLHRWAGSQRRLLSAMLWTTMTGPAIAM